ncbi:MAG: zinc-dependent alcohol dehydrogenase family protein [Rubrobacter sp.]
MKATVFHAAGDVRVEEVPDPKIQNSTDAVVRITHACVCGSDLWFYRGIWDWQQGYRCGHEWMGVVEDVGSDVTSLEAGDRVIAPFTYSDGSCEYCEKELYTSCIHGNSWGGADDDGGQAEGIRVPFADGTLVKLPDSVEGDDKLLKAILPLTDVMSTGHHAAVSAKVGQGSMVAVVGDGAVGLSGVLAAKRLGAERIILCGRHDERIAVAKKFGATDIVKERGEEGITKVREMTDGGAAHVMEAVGNKGSMALAIGAVRSGGNLGYVGVPNEEIALGGLFGNNITLAGGAAPARSYIPELLEDVIAGKIDPSPVFDKTVDLAGVPEGYAAMDDRTAIKTMIVV